MTRGGLFGFVELSEGCLLPRPIVNNIPRLPTNIDTDEGNRNLSPSVSRSRLDDGQAAKFIRFVVPAIGRRMSSDDWSWQGSQERHVTLASASSSKKATSAALSYLSLIRFLRRNE